MKRLFIYLLLLFPLYLFGQTEANLLFNWNDTTIAGSNSHNNRYNEIWGLVANDREFAVIGSTEGIHFADVTDPVNSVMLPNAFVEGAVNTPQIIHRDFKNYGCYLYAVADEGPSTLQIIDYSTLPDSVSVVYDSNVLIRRAHNVVIDEATARLYAVTTANDTEGFSPVRIYSLADPANPVFMGSWNPSFIGHIHDAYIKNNIAYLNCGNAGFYIVDFTEPTNPVVLGSLTAYPQQGYNHSGWPSEDGNYFYMADETFNMDIKVLDISDVTDIRVVDTIDIAQSEINITHNQLVRGNYLYVSWYFDGLQIFDITDHANPVRAFYYDTYSDANAQAYRGAWGVYPFLPSGNILVSDMQYGLHVFEKVDNTIDGTFPPHCPDFITTTNIPQTTDLSLKVYPQPVNEEFNIRINSGKANELTVELFDLTGRSIVEYDRQNVAKGSTEVTLSVPNGLAKGMYFLKVSGKGVSLSKKMILN